MKAIVHVALLLSAVSSAGFACAADSPSDGIDLNALKPKSQSSTAGNVIGGSSSSANQKTTGTPGATTNTTPAGIGSSIKSPLGAKGGIGPVGAPGTNKPAQSAQEDTTSSSNDVQVKMPSNFKK